MHEKITLENGVRIVFEKIPYVRSAAVGIWVGSGSRHEGAAENGASHFIEHMMFKGTESRSASDIAVLMDEIGGQVNAFTGKECTCYYARGLDIHLMQAMDILCDMFFNSKFDEGDVAAERGVILEEIDMYEDTPEDLAGERLYSKIFKGSPLGLPILGSAKTLDNMTGEFLKSYMKRRYGPDRVVIALSGSISDKDIDYIKGWFGAMEKTEPVEMKKARYQPAVTAKKKAIEQNHLCLAFPGLDQFDGDRYALQLLSGILGGGMSSRLFQTLRERLGICYSVYSYTSSYKDTGLFGIYTALGREMEEKALGAIAEEISMLKEDGVTQKDLDRNREQMKANVLMSLESTNSRMNRLGRGEVLRGETLTADEIIASYDAVTTEQVRELARKLLNKESLSLSAVGKVGTAASYDEMIGKLSF